MPETFAMLVQSDTNFTFGGKWPDVVTVIDDPLRLNFSMHILCTIILTYGTNRESLFNNQDLLQQALDHFFYSYIRIVVIQECYCMERLDAKHS